MTVGSVTQHEEVLSGDPRPIPRWQRLALVVVVVAVAAGWLVDARVRHHESQRLAACDRGLRTATRAYDTRMGAMYEYVRPSAGMLPKAQNALVSSLMVQPATRVLPAVESAVAVCRRVHVLPWHIGSVARRRADLAYGDALRVHLVDVVARQGTFHMYDARLSRLRASARIPTAFGS